MIKTCPLDYKKRHHGLINLKIFVSYHRKRAENDYRW